MVDKKTILVFGATGIQGGSVVDAILRDPKLTTEWHIKGVTRDVSKPAAKAYEAKGVEMLTADLEDKASIKAAMEGSYAVFLVTNFWESMNPDVEIKQGKNAADVAKEVGIQHFIFSSLENISEISNGKYKHVSHFDGKAAIADYALSLGLPCTFFQPGVYMSNFRPTQSFRPNPQTGKWTIALPIPVDQPIVPMIDTKADTGKFVVGILKNRDTLLGKKIRGASRYYSLNELIAEFKQAKPEAGADAVAVQVPDDVFKGFLGQAGMPEFIHQEMLENFTMLADCGYYAGESLEESLKIVSEPLVSFKEFVENDESFANVK